MSAHSQQSRVVDYQLEAAIESGGRFFAKHHAFEENLEIFHHRADVRIDLQAQDYYSVLAVNLKLRVHDRVVDSVMNVRADRLAVSDAASAHVALVREDERRGDPG